MLYPKRYAEIEQMVVDAGARARGVPATRAHRAARPARRAAHRRRGHRPPEALLVDLREDDHAGQGVRRRAGPRRRARRRRVGEGLLRRARFDPRDVEAGAGPVQGLHRDAQVQPLPVVAHDGRRAVGQAGRGADPHAGDAPARRVRHRRALGLQGARARRGPRSGCSAWSTGSRRPPTPASSWSR